jgi:hypothetical protein
MFLADPYLSKSSIIIGSLLMMQISSGCAIRTFLSAEDQVSFKQLKDSVGSPAGRYNRNRKVQVFQEILGEVLMFCTRGEAETPKRFLACGICPINGCFATNTQQLGRLLDRSKSSINGMFAAMGYESVPIPQPQVPQLQQILQSEHDPTEARRWTLRRIKEEVVQPTFQSNVKNTEDDDEWNPDGAEPLDSSVEEWDSFDIFDL